MHEHDTKPGVPIPNPVGERPRGSGLGLAVLVGLVVLAGFGGGWPLLLVIASILVMIFLHELGHYVTAKAAGMKVTEFFIGFGPRIWSFRRGETEYGVKAIPAGAYVKIVGMHNLDEFDPADADRTYMSKPFWRRLSVAVAGSAMHFLLAIVALGVTFAFVGFPGGEYHTPGTGDTWVVDDPIAPDSPAAAAGLEPGDQLLSLDGVSTTSFDDFRDAVVARPGETVDIVVLRDGAPLTLEATLASSHPSSGSPGGFLGVGPAEPDEATVGALAAVRESFDGFGSMLGDTFSGLAQVLSPAGLSDLGQRVLDARDTPDGPTVSDGGASSGSGSDDDGSDANRPISVIGVADIAAQVVDEGEWTYFLWIFAMLNVFIGVFNLVPLLPLDGGHVAIAVYEKIQTVIRRQSSYHVDVTKLLPITYAVVLVLVFLGLSTVYLDIADPIGG